MKPSIRRYIGRDIQIFGGLFLVVGMIDMVIIALYPHYALKIFGTTLVGMAGYLSKLQSPLIHFLIGYGFLFKRSWAWGLGLAYAGFGIVSEIMNQVAWGFSGIRSAFILMTLLFGAYLIRRRDIFTGLGAWPEGDAPTSEEAP